MRHSHSITTTLVALCLLASSVAQPALAGGLISTERALEPGPTVAVAALQPPRLQVEELRTTLVAALVHAGVDARHAQQRADSLTNAEVLDIAQRLNDAPAGGLWFAPFLVVAMVIGALIGTRSHLKEAPSTSTDLFGRPQSVAAVP
jgi:hypothetical protein